MNVRAWTTAGFVGAALTMDGSGGSRTDTAAANAVDASGNRSALVPLPAARR